MDCNVERLVPLGHRVRATVVRPYNGHETNIFGKITKIMDEEFVVKPLLGNPITFLKSDIGKTVFFVDDNWEDFDKIETHAKEGFIGMLPNAKCAREESNKHLVSKIDEEMAVIIEKLNSATQNGLYNTEVDFYISNEMKDILTSRGYTFRHGSQCDAPYTVIKW